jgi:DNA-binding MarR family transcriptional regulator
VQSPPFNCSRHLLIIALVRQPKDSITLPDTKTRLTNLRISKNTERPTPASLSEDHVLQCAIRLRGVVMRLSRQLRSGLKRDGLSTASLGLLGQLHRLGPITPTELAAQEKVRLQSLTRLLAELEAAKWIERAPHAADGRRTLVSLSQEGRRRLADAVHAGETSIAQSISNTFDSAQRAALLDACAMLETLADAMGTQPSGAERQDEKGCAAWRKKI